MSRFTDRVERDLGQIADRATPSSAAWSSILGRIADQNHSHDTEVIMFSPDHNDSPPIRRWLLVAAAVATVALVGALFVAAAGSDNDGVPADQPDSEAPDPGDSESDPSVSADSAAATAVGERFVQAFADRDADAAVAELGETPESVNVFGASDPGELTALFDWFDVVDWNFEPRGCEFGEPDQVSCTAGHSNAWYGPVGLAPVEGRFFLKVQDEEVTAVRFDVGADDVQAFEPFIEFVIAESPDDMEVMFDTDSGGNSRCGLCFGPQLTDEAVALFGQYTAAYLADSGEGGAGAANGEGAAAASPSDLIGTWTATNRAPGTTWEVTDDVIAANLVGPNQTRESVQTAYTATDTTLELGEEEGFACPTGQIGIYDWTIADGVLTVTLVSDDCTGRGEHNDGMILERTE